MTIKIIFSSWRHFEEYKKIQKSFITPHFSYVLSFHFFFPVRYLRIMIMSYLLSCDLLFFSSHAHEMENKKFWNVYYEHLEKAATHAGM